MGVVAKELAENHNFFFAGSLTDWCFRSGLLPSLSVKKEKKTKKISKFVLNLGKNAIYPSFLSFP